MKRLESVTCACGHTMTFLDCKLTAEQIEHIQSGPCVACTHPTLFPVNLG